MKEGVSYESNHKIAGRKRDVLTLIDFSRPSTEKRLFVFDMKQRRLLFSSVCYCSQYQRTDCTRCPMRHPFTSDSQ